MRLHAIQRIVVCFALGCLATLCPVGAASAQADAQPLRVYILAGQSNMEGHAMTRTFGYIGEDPRTAPLLDLMTNDDASPTVADHVWVTNLTGSSEDPTVLNGPLTAGFGARRDPGALGDKIGPEFTFGLTLEQHYDGPILLIKCAWGGKSLHTDFRPPSAGPFEPNAQMLEGLVARAQRDGGTFDRAAWQAERDAQTGVYYRLMMQHVQAVLADPGAYCPAYNADAGYELAGFVWFQGWNDMVARDVYPNRDQPGGYDLYSQLFAHFIRDVRSTLDAPELPFVIGVMGVGGEGEGVNQTNLNFRAGMAAPASMREFRGSVVAVPTAPYWPSELDPIIEANGQVSNMARMLRTENRNGPNADGSMDAAAQRAYLDNYRSQLITEEDQARLSRATSNQGYHYMGCGKTMAQIGQAFAQAVIEMDDE